MSHTVVHFFSWISCPVLLFHVSYPSIVETFEKRIFFYQEWPMSEFQYTAEHRSSLPFYTEFPFCCSFCCTKLEYLFLILHFSIKIHFIQWIFQCSWEFFAIPNIFNIKIWAIVLSAQEALETVVSWREHLHFHCWFGKSLFQFGFVSFWFSATFFQLHCCWKTV